MSNDNTYIEPPPPPRFQPPPEEPPLPPMPPPPGPPGRERNWVPLAILMGLLIVVLCGFAAFGIWRLVQGGAIPSGGDEGTATPDPVALTQTALIEDVQDTLLFTETPTSAPTDPPEPTAAPATGTPASTEIPTNTLAPTSSVPTFTASQAIFCRTGPSTIYEERRTMQDGMTLPILGQSISPVDNVSVWYLVEIEGAQCYVSSGFGTVEGDLSDVPFLDPPPTPTPTLTPTPTPTATPTATPTP